MNSLEKIDFEDGSWWVFRSYLSHGADRAVSEIARRHFKVEGRVTAEGVVSGDLEVDVDYAALPWPEMNDALVLKSTTEWSYGPVTADTLESVPKDHFERVLKRLNEVIGAEAPLARNGQSA